MQILAVSCDNASANDVMIREMADRIAHFAGDPNRVRCFAHVVALVAKSMLRQFDPPKSKKKKKQDGEDQDHGDDFDLDDDTLRAMAADLDDEEAEMEQEVDQDGVEKDQDEGWIDELSQMSEAERFIHEDDIRPVRLALVKVRDLTKLRRLVSQCCRSESWRTRSFTPPPSSALGGRSFVSSTRLQTSLFLATSAHDGIPRTICSTLR